MEVLSQQLRFTAPHIRALLQSIDGEHDMLYLIMTTPPRFHGKIGAGIGVENKFAHCFSLNFTLSSLDIPSLIVMLIKQVEIKGKLEICRDHYMTFQDSPSIYSVSSLN